MSVEDYKNHVRKLPCLICGHGSDSHHLFSIGMGRDRTKPKWEDFTVMPLCREHHTELHQTGMTKFSKGWQIHLYKEALKILAKWIFNEDK